MVSEALRKFREKAKEQSGGFEKDHSVFPFWNLPFEGSATLRLIPFEDKLSGQFWTEKKIIRMSFVDPQDDSKLIRFEAPCYEMYAKDHKCPVLQPARDLYEEADAQENAGDDQEAERLRKIAGAHWIKPVFYDQGFVVKPGINEAEVPENPVRVFPFLKQIHQVIFGKLMSEEEDGFDFLPTGEFSMQDVNDVLTDGALSEDEIERVLNKFLGINFILKKIQKGKYANYQTSSWSMSPSMLTEDQLEGLNEHGLHDLRQRLPKQPTDEQYEIMTEMVNVSIGRLMGDDEGLWNPEWAEAGLEPKRDKRASGGDDGDDDKPAKRRTSNAAKTLKSQLNRASTESGGEEDDSASDTTEEVMSKVKKRGAKAAKPADADTDAKPAPTKSELAARITKGLKKGSDDS